MLARTPSDTLRDMPPFVRADGLVRLSVAASGRGSRVADLAESGGFRAKFPRGRSDLAEAIIVNTAGGMTGGDRLQVDARVGEGAAALITTQAAEKIYRSDGVPTRIETRLSLDDAGRCIWAPQETLLFDGACLQRSLDVAMAETAELVVCESLVFGRLAMGERLAAGSLRDRWRIRRGGRLIFAEDLRLEGGIADALDRAAVAARGRALATLLIVAPGAETRIEDARAVLADMPCECAASALPDLILARFLAREPADLRQALAHYLTRFAGVAIPRSWLC